MALVYFQGNVFLISYVIVGYLPNKKTPSCLTIPLHPALKRNVCIVVINQLFYDEFTHCSCSILFSGVSMSNSTSVLSTLLVLCSIAIAETHITGSITDMTFESGGNPFIVEQDIMIPEGKKVVINSGCVFLFKPFTGLSVHGHLVVEGTQEAPVMFTSINDGEFNAQSEQLANPFDWNGILVSRESGTVIIQNFSLRFSVYGIKSQNLNIQIENGLFRQNGQFHFTINDKIQFVQDNIPYSYSGSGDAVTGKPVKNLSSTTNKQAKKSSSTSIKIFRYSSLGIGVIGTASSAIFGALSMDSYSRWSDTTDASYSINYKKNEERFKSNLAASIVTGVIGILGLTGFGISFAF